MLRCERGFAGVVCRVSKGASLAANPLQVVKPDGEHFVSSGSRQAVSPAALADLAEPIKALLVYHDEG